MVLVCEIHLDEDWTLDLTTKHGQGEYRESVHAMMKDRPKSREMKTQSKISGGFGDRFALNLLAAETGSLNVIRCIAE